MAVETVKPRDVRAILANLKGFLNVPVHSYWVDYDEEADVLYLSFQKPQRATDSELTDEGTILNKRGNQVVGLTILEASKR